MHCRSCFAAVALCLGAAGTVLGQFDEVDFGDIEIQRLRVADIRPTIDPAIVVDTIPFGAIDIPGLRAAEADRIARGERPLKFATIRDDATYTPADSGTVVDLPRDRVAWRLRLETANAENINLAAHFDVPPSTVLYLLDGDGNVAHGPYTAADVKPHGERWFSVVDVSL